ncbi:TetR/AcrR family transcriptional regulator [Chryseobacterium sp. OSA05B]|uniref:TetR/AcrR family transcriptional regulator n=1 Tax=Chryseobacterium sp. OSA05B TaxID=2862650 RepID=UPI001CC1AA7C|nr:TetR/AcrR family transcriptional regulator [Chryseobacterium sp. OSA05B]
MRGRPTVHHDEDLILKAQEVFWKKGYSAASLSDLLEATGTGSGSFYNTFKGGKKEIFKKSLQQRKDFFMAFKNELDQAEDPLKKIKDFYLSIADEDNESHMKGCILVNSVLEMTFVDDELEQLSANILREVEEMYTDVIRQSQKKGQIKNQTPADILGKYLVTFWCGLNSLRKIYPERNVLKNQIEFQLKILE